MLFVHDVLRALGISGREQDAPLSSGGLALTLVVSVEEGRDAESEKREERSNLSRMEGRELKERATLSLE